jgi:hypothetical protein
MKKLIFLMSLILISKAQATDITLDEALINVNEGYDSALTLVIEYQDEIKKLTTIRKEYNSSSERIYTPANKAKFKSTVKYKAPNHIRNKINYKSELNNDISNLKSQSSKIQRDYKSWVKREKGYIRDKESKAVSYKNKANSAYRSHQSSIASANLSYTTAQLAQTNYNMCMNNCRSTGYCYCNNYLNSKNNALNSARRSEQNAEQQYQNYKEYLRKNKTAYNDAKYMSDSFNSESRRRSTTANQKINDNNSSISYKRSIYNGLASEIDAYINPRVKDLLAVALKKEKARVSLKYTKKRNSLISVYGGSEVFNTIADYINFVNNNFIQNKAVSKSTDHIELQSAICAYGDNNSLRKIQDICSEINILSRLVDQRNAVLEERLKSNFFTVCWNSDNTDGKFDSVQKIANKTELKTCETILFAIQDSNDFSFSGIELKTLDLIKEFTHLTALWANFNSLTDISALKDFTNLKSVNIHDNEISDFSVLTELPNLETIKYFNNTASKKTLKKLCKSLGLAKSNCQYK